MTSPLPTIVFLAGAFAEPSCFDNLAAEFNKAGYPTIYASILSLNPNDHTGIAMSKDAEHVRNNFLLPLLEDGRKSLYLSIPMEE